MKKNNSTTKYVILCRMIGFLGNPSRKLQIPADAWTRIGMEYDTENDCLKDIRTLRHTEDPDSPFEYKVDQRFYTDKGTLQ